MYEMYRAQARLLLHILPMIKKYRRLALKGGTALNFFIQNFPRLSVDIDLAYTEIDERDEALAYITNSLEDLSKTIRQRFSGSQVTEKRISDGTITGLIVNFE